MKLEIENKVQLEGIDQNNFTMKFDLTLEILGRHIDLVEKWKNTMIQLTFIDDAEIQLLNREYRNQDRPTDVISLSYLEGISFPGEDLVGEIFISVETAKRQAEENNIFLNDELLFLFVHGMLHVFGYDHIKEDDKKVMFDLQRKILELNN